MYNNPQLSATTVSAPPSQNYTNKDRRQQQQGIEHRRTRKRRRKIQSSRPPAVDSTLLRFVGRQKQALGQPDAFVDDNVSLSEDPLPQQQQPCVEKRDATIPRERGKSGPDTLKKDGDDLSAPATWWGQYNSHRVETVLLSKDSTLDRTSVRKAGARVQAQVLARTVRRRIRTFLKERDRRWSSNLASTLTIGSVGEMMGYLGGHTFEQSLDVMMEHGLTAKDVPDILQHSPGIVLMRPRGRENGDCLDNTVDRVFKLLCVTLKLRKYDARKIVRASPSLLTMRGSKSAEDVISLLSHLGVSHNAVARDKASLTDFLSRSPAAIFRLVSFLAGDAIRMPVDKIGPLLRRRLSNELLDAVAPVPQPTHSNSSTSTLTVEPSGSASTSDLEDELDPWIASALWGRQSQIRRDRVDLIFRKMTRTAWTLRKEVGTADLSKVVAAYPSVLLLDAENQILPNADYLMHTLGICKGDLTRVLQLYPLLLGLPMERMDAVANFLRSLGIAKTELTSIFRSFPALLALDIEKDMIPVVRFLQSIGVMDVGRFLKRIPPILGYSVELELIPKWRFLESVSSDPRFEVTRFPAYFSYPLERVIKARYEYIRDVKKYPTQLISVDKVVSYGDEEFAVRTLKEKDEGRAFQRFQDWRNEFQHPKKKKQKKKIVNKGGSTKQ